MCGWKGVILSWSLATLQLNAEVGDHLSVACNALAVMRPAPHAARGFLWPVVQEAEHSTQWIYKVMLNHRDSERRCADCDEEPSQCRNVAPYGDGLSTQRCTLTNAPGSSAGLHTTSCHSNLDMGRMPYSTI